MGSRRPEGLVALAFLWLVACGPSVADNGGDDDDDTPGEIDAAPGERPDARTSIDASLIDSGSAYPDAEPIDNGGSCGDDWQCDTPVNDGCDLGGPDICDNGSDDNCNGEVDEACPCTPGDVQACFLGQPGRRNVGSCTDGMQTCFGSGEFARWGDCTGGIRPGDEQCDGADNNCNGCEDDHPECCEVELSCPDSSAMPEGQPFVDYVIDGTQFYGGAVTSWTWTVTGGPCDQLFVADGHPPSFELNGANTSQLTISPTLSGDLTVTVTIVAANGETYTCTFIIHIAGPGLRIEMCSDVTENTDLDLHVHRPGTTTQWFGNNTSNINTDDCYYWTCPATADPVANWGYATSPLSACEGGPQGALWQLQGACRNPRLDIDSIRDAGVPENINIDVPQAAAYRVMVHYYSGGTTVAHPMVNIYCGGHLRATYGAAPDVLTDFNQSGGWGAGDMWRVADITPVVSGGVTTDCSIDALHPPGTSSGYWVTTNDRSY